MGLRNRVEKLKVECGRCIRRRICTGGCSTRPCFESTAFGLRILAAYSARRNHAAPEGFSYMSPSEHFSRSQFFCLSYMSQKRILDLLQ